MIVDLTPVAQNTINQFLASDIPAAKGTEGKAAIPPARS